MTLRISVVIVNYNGGDYLLQCLDALKNQAYQPDDILVIDNASSDGSADRALKGHPQVRLYSMNENIGFAAANNHAFHELAKESESRKSTSSSTRHWVALLNPDTRPQPMWLVSLVNAIDAFPDHDVFSSQLVWAEDPEILDGRGDIHHVSGLSWRRHHGRRIEDVSRGPMIDPLFSPCGAAALYQLDRLLEVGGMDERYFCYHEDVDLMFRLRLTGSKAHHVEHSVVEHVGSAITGRGSDFSVYHGHRNLVWTYVKNMPGWLFWRYLPQHLLLNAFSIVFYGVKGRPRVILKAKWDALKVLPALLRQRAQIQANRKVSTKTISAALAKGWLTPYLFRRR